MLSGLAEMRQLLSTLNPTEGCRTCLGTRPPRPGSHALGRAFGRRRGQEGRGAQAPPRRRRRGAPARARRPQGFGAGSGRSSGGDPRGAGEGAAHQENLGGRRIPRREAGVRAHEARHRNRSGDRQKTQGSQGLHGPATPLGRGADLRLDVALPTLGEGLRAELGELLGVGAADRVPLHDAPDRKGRNMLMINNKMGFMNFRSYSYFR